MFGFPLYLWLTDIISAYLRGLIVLFGEENVPAPPSGAPRPE
jgi:hypothetical protein